MKKISLALLAWLAVATPAFAANIDIPALPAAASVGGTDLNECSQAGTSRKCTAAQIAAYVYGLASGDLTANGTGGHTLATVNGNVGSFGSTTQCTSITVNGKGLITAASQAACAPPFSAVTGRSTLAQAPQGIANSIWINPTGSTADMQNLAVPACANDGTHALVYVNGSGLVCATITGTGTVTSIATSCGVVGGTITTTGTIRGATSDSTISGTSYSIVDGDCGLIKRSTNAALTTITVGSPAGFTNPSNWFTTIKSDGAAGVSIAVSGVTIDGSASPITVATGRSLDLYSDGTNYHTLPGNGGGGSGTVTTTGTPASGNLARFSGASSITNGNISGDCATSNTLAVTCPGLTPPNYKATYWYLAFPPAPMTTGQTFTAGQIYCRLFQFPRLVTFTNVGLSMTTGVAAGNIQIAFYTNDASTNLPGALIQSTASISTATNGNKSGALGGAVQFGPGGSSAGRDVWGCVNSDNATHVATAYSSNFSLVGSLMGAPTQAGIVQSGGSGGLDNISCNGANCNTGSSTYGTWQSSLVGSTWTYNNLQSRFPALMFQATSSP